MSETGSNVQEDTDDLSPGRRTSAEARLKSEHSDPHVYEDTQGSSDSFLDAVPTSQGTPTSSHEKEVAAELRQVLSTGSFAGLLMQLAGSSGSSCGSSKGSADSTSKVSASTEVAVDEGKREKRRRQVSPGLVDQRHLEGQAHSMEGTENPQKIEAPPPLVAFAPRPRTLETPALGVRMAATDHTMSSMQPVVSRGQSGTSDSAGSLNFANMSPFSSIEFPIGPTLLTSPSFPSSSSEMPEPVTSLGLLEGQASMSTDWQEGVPLDSPSEIFMSQGGDGGSGMVMGAPSTFSAPAPTAGDAVDERLVGLASPATSTATSTTSTMHTITTMMDLQSGQAEGSRAGYQPVLNADTHFPFSASTPDETLSLPSPSVAAASLGPPADRTRDWQGRKGLRSETNTGSLLVGAEHPRVITSPTLPTLSSSGARGQGQPRQIPPPPLPLPAASPMATATMMMGHLGFNTYYAPPPVPSSLPSASKASKSAAATVTPAGAANRAAAAALTSGSRGSRTRRRSASLSTSSTPPMLPVAAIPRAAAATRPTIDTAAEVAESSTGLLRGSYRCGRCGGMKKNHVCPYLYEEHLERRDAGTEVDLVLTRGDPDKGGRPNMPSGMSFHFLTVRARENMKADFQTLLASTPELDIRMEAGIPSTHTSSSSAPLLPLPVPMSVHGQAMAHSALYDNMNMSLSIQEQEPQGQRRQLQQQQHVYPSPDQAPAIDSQVPTDMEED